MVDEDRIMAHLHMLLGTSEPGDEMHHLHVLTAPAATVGPLGFPAPETVRGTVYALAPVGKAGDVDVDGFIVDVVSTITVNARAAGEMVLFAGISMEGWIAEPYDELARELLAQHRLPEHPNAAEVTMVYGACRDGRRWTGRRYVSGPKAGVSEDVQLLVGRPAPDEGGSIRTLIRRLVGMAG